MEDSLGTGDKRWFYINDFPLFYSKAATTLVGTDTAFTVASLYSSTSSSYYSTTMAGKPNVITFAITIVRPAIRAFVFEFFIYDS